MRVFISWSGERSKLVAEALHYWLPNVIQAVEPWMSSSDIEKGARWRAGLAAELELSSVSIICLTPENLEAPWIHFEAGALSKQQVNTYVCTFLYGLDPANLREPLAQFQATKAEKEDIRNLVHTINNSLGNEMLVESKLNETFDVWWPKLEQRLSNIPESQNKPNPQRDMREILEEVLGLVRSQVSSKNSWSLEKPSFLLSIPKFPLPPDEEQVLTGYIMSMLEPITQKEAGLKNTLERIQNQLNEAASSESAARKLLEGFELLRKRQNTTSKLSGSTAKKRKKATPSKKR